MGLRVRLQGLGFGCRTSGFGPGSKYGTAYHGGGPVSRYSSNSSIVWSLGLSLKHLWSCFFRGFGFGAALRCILSCTQNEGYVRVIKRTIVK